MIRHNHDFLKLEYICPDSATYKLVIYGILKIIELDIIEEFIENTMTDIMKVKLMNIFAFIINEEDVLYKTIRMVLFLMLTKQSYQCDNEIILN